MFDISKLTPQQLEKMLHMDSIIAGQKEAAEKVLALRAYYDGDHPVMLSQRMREAIGDLLTNNAFPGFAHNVVRSVIDTLRERLSVTGINIDGVAEDDTTSPAAQVQAAMWLWWTKARTDSDQIRLYRRALRDGLGYIMVDFDPETMRPRFTLHHVDAGEQEPGIMLHRDPSDQNKVMYATRYFTEFNPLEPGVTGTKRKTVYLPDQIRKYVQGKAGWEPTQDAGDVSWPIPWTDRTGAPLGIPVVEFANPGGSEVAQIIPLQNLLNKGWLDLAMGADYHGFGGLGIEYDSSRLGPRLSGGSEDDADSEGSDEIRMSPARLLEVDDGHIVRIPPGDLAQLIAFLDRVELAISGVSRTPAYYLRPVGGADVPSGEALKQLESGLVRRAEERQLVFGQAWEDVFALAYRVNQAFGPSLPDVPDMTINVTWADANVRNELATAQVAEAHKRLEVPNRKIWAMLEYTPEEIAEFEQAQQQAKQADIAMVMAAARTDASRQGAQTNGGTNGRTNNPVG
jgi:hypothetical protein